MKRIVAILGLSLLWPQTQAQAACAHKDFDVENFKISMSARVGGAKRFSIKGDLVNHCGEPAAAQIRVIAMDSNGREVKAEDGWPAGSNNIPPGQSVSFDFGPLFKFDPAFDQFGVAIVQTKTW